jgi:hypothetical protein
MKVGHPGALLPAGGTDVPTEAQRIVTLADLIARLEGARGPDRDLDFALHRLDMGEWLDREGYSRNGDGYFSTSAKYPRVAGPEHFTGSLDAALALVERKLPGWGIYMRSDRDGCGAGLTYPKHNLVTPGHVETKTLPLAVCLALLRALQAQEGGEG